MKNGFTLVEMIAIIVILAVVSVLSFSSMTKTLKNTDDQELQTFKGNIENACSVYVESFINNHFVGTDTEDIYLLELMNEKFLSKSMKNPTDCDNEHVVITATKNADKTISYQVRCLKGNTYSELKKVSSE